MNCIELNDLREGYIKVCKQVIHEGDYVSPRGMRTKELTGVTLVFPDPMQCMLPIGTGRVVNTNLAAVEALGVISGTWPHDLILKAAPRYTEVLVDPSKQAATEVAYGPRIKHQIENLVNVLRNDECSRQAVVQIWNLSDVFRNGDKPCTLSLQFLLRNFELEMVVNMRSQDVWFGLAIDAFVFSQLQMTIANILDVAVGKYVHHVGSLHAYERDWSGINNLSLAVGLASVPYGLNDLEEARRLLGGGTGHHWYMERIQKLISKKVEV